jgi:3-hydroxypropanoate dehydrogenase
MLDSAALKLLFTEARTHNAWQPKPIPEGLLEQVYDLAKMGPTSANCQPARFVALQSASAKARLKPHLIESNVEKTMSAPVTIIVGSDTQFYEKLPRLFPHTDARAWFVGNDALIQATAFRNSTLQAAYLMLAARALGLDCGAMSGFNAEGVDQEFFAGTATKANFLINLGYGDEKGLFGRSPRLSFTEAFSVI